ncbi:MAG: FtsX-like permease family protein [Candidatus Hydrogenedens sp.]|nr:ABC transporter permease [Candidatus Hydrogenedentota bacterium]NLF57346.1 FtsX-like permease family protein [Candidatus Hydrogenedens sp.]
MLFWTTVKVAVRSLWAAKMRSMLSMLGIIIGVGAVIAMLAVGAGAQRQVLDHVTALGSDLIMVMPGQFRSGGVRGGSVETLTLEDAAAVAAELPEALRVSPVVRGNGQFKYYNANKQSSVMGVSPEYLPIRNFEIAAGRMFTDGEVERRAKVAVLGSDTAADLFDGADPVGGSVKINGVPFQITGVLKAKGTQGPFSFDDQALVPYTTAMKRLFGMDYLSEVDIQIARDADQAVVQAKLESLLRKRHGVREGKDDDFNVRNMAEMVETATSVTRIFTLLLGSVAAISLVVGGIGIMNIMLVTVTERTREIGIRKAIGARDRDILVQFLLESMIMSALGGFIGVAAGVGSARVGSLVSGFNAVVEVDSVLLALVFAVCVGVFFGFYPARRAAALDPVESLSYE